MKELFTLIIHFRLRDLFLKPTQNEFVRIFRYLFVGGTAFLFDFGVYALANAWFGDADLMIALETALGFLVGLTVNFLLSKRFIFTEKANGLDARGEFLAYGLIGVVGLFLSMGLTVLGAKIMNELLARALVAILVLFYNYFARKLLLYRRKEETA